MKTIDTTYTPANEIVKYDFFDKLEHSMQKDKKTVVQYIYALHEFEVATGFKDFKKYNSDWAKHFKNYLEDKKNARTGRAISKSLYLHYISHVRQFFEWLVKNHSDYKKISADDIAYLNISKNDANKARATKFQDSHDVADILSTIRNMPKNTVIERRNKAMISLCLLTTPRISSLQTAQIKSIKYLKDYDVWAFIQHPASQNTKYSKNITAIFMGQCADIIANVVNWQNYLIEQGFKPNDYLFPRALPSFDENGQSILTLSKELIKSQTQIRDAFKAAFIGNNLPYYKPHTFRHSLARKGRKQQDPTNLIIALAENMGQKSGMATVIASYAGDYLKTRAALMKGFLLE